MTEKRAEETSTWCPCIKTQGRFLLKRKEYPNLFLSVENSFYPSVQRHICF